MKIIVPKHVEAWLFDMWIDIWMFRMKFWQLILLAVGLWITFWIMNSLMKHWLWKLPAFIIASPWLLIMLFIAFFKKSELHIIPFWAKLIRTYIINTPKTLQRNIDKIWSWEIKLNFAKLNKWEENNINQKDLKKDEIEKNLDILSKW